MFSVLEIVLDKPTDDWSSHVGSVFHGVIMENVSQEYGEKLHENGVKPYSQNIIVKEEEIIWTIKTMTSEARSNILIPFLEESKNTIYINHKKTELKIIKKTLKEESYDSLMKRSFFSDNKRYITVKFNTHTAFKTNGEYQFYPTVALFFNSLIQKHDTVSEETKLFTKELREGINENITITDYNLRSTKFHFEGVKIPAFVGKVTFRIGGPQQFVNLIKMVISFGEYSGVGIKSALGMGAIEILKKKGSDVSER